MRRAGEAVLWILSFVLVRFSGKLGHPLPGDRFIVPLGLLCASGARLLARPMLLQGSSGIQPFWWSGSFRRSKKWDGPLGDPVRSRPISPHAPNERPQPTQLVHAHCTWCCRTQPSADLHAGLDVSHNPPLRPIRFQLGAPSHQGAQAMIACRGRCRAKPC